MILLFYEGYKHVDTTATIERNDSSATSAIIEGKILLHIDTPTAMEGTILLPVF